MGLCVNDCVLLGKIRQGLTSVMYKYASVEFGGLDADSRVGVGIWNDTWKP